MRGAFVPCRVACAADRPSLSAAPPPPPPPSPKEDQNERSISCAVQRSQAARRTASSPSILHPWQRCTSSNSFLRPVTFFPFRAEAKQRHPPNPCSSLSICRRDGCNGCVESRAVVCARRHCCCRHREHVPVTIASLPATNTNTLGAAPVSPPSEPAASTATTGASPTDSLSSCESVKRQRPACCATRCRSRSEVRWSACADAAEAMCNLAASPSSISDAGAHNIRRRSVVYLDDSAPQAARYFGLQNQRLIIRHSFFSRAARFPRKALPFVATVETSSPTGSILWSMHPLRDVLLSVTRLPSLRGESSELARWRLAGHHLVARRCKNFRLTHRANSMTHLFEPVQYHRPHVRAKIMFAVRWLQAPVCSREGRCSQRRATHVLQPYLQHEDDARTDQHTSCMPLCMFRSGMPESVIPFQKVPCPAVSAVAYCSKTRPHQTPAAPLTGLQHTANTSLFCLLTTTAFPAVSLCCFDGPRGCVYPTARSLAPYQASVITNLEPVKATVFGR